MDGALGQAVLPYLAGEEVAAGDLQLLVLGVAGQLDDLHAVAQRPGDRVLDVGGADEEDAGEVERHVQVVVGERVVLRGVEHLEQGRGGIAPEVDAQLVDLVQHHERVGAAGALDLLDDAAGHGAHVGAAVAPDLGLVPHAPERDADELAAEGAGYRLAQGGLAGPWRADEAEDRPPRLAALQLDDGEEVQDAALHLLQPVVVFVQDALGPLDVQLVLGELPPGQVGQPLEVGARDLVLRRDAGDVGQALQLPLRLPARRLRKLRLLEPPLKLRQLRRRLALPELALDRLHLLAEDELPLALVDLAAHLALDLGLDFQHLLLVRQDLADAVEPAVDVELGQDGVAFVGVDLEVGGYEVGERRGVGDVRDGGGELVGQRLRHLDDALKAADGVADGGLELQISLDRLLEALDAGPQERLLLD